MLLPGRWVKLTCDREVVEWWEAVVTGHLGLLFIADEGAIALQDEVARPPCFNVFPWKTERRRILIRQSCRV